MTLVVQMMVGDVPIMIGDVLVTSPGKSHNASGVPALRDVNKYLPDGHQVHISGMVQKVNVLSDRLTLAFAGDGDQAKDVAETFDNIANFEGLDRELIWKTLETLDMDRTDKLQMIGVLTTHISDDEGGTEYWYFGLGIEETHVGPFGKALIAGSGEADFLETLGGLVPAYPYIMKQSGNKFTRAEMVGLAIASNFTGYEFLDGRNLLRSWGGGIELLTFKNGSFTKLDDIAHVFWRVISKADGSYSLRFVPRFVKNQYWDDALIIRIVEFEHGAGENESLMSDDAYLVLPVLKRIENYDLSNFPRPEYTCKTLCCYVHYEVDENSSLCLSHIMHDSSGVSDFSFRSDGENHEILLGKQLVREIQELVLERVGVHAEFDQAGR